LKKNNNQTCIPNSLEWLVTTDYTILCEFLNKYYSNKLTFTNALLQLCVTFALLLVNKTTKAICGCVCCSIKNMVMFDKQELFAEALFLCVHPTYRKKNCVQTIMNELSRYVNVTYSIQQGYFITKNKTSIIDPIATLRTYCRPINYLKLHESGFMEIKGTLEQLDKQYKVDYVVEMKYAKLDVTHMHTVLELYNFYMSKYNIYTKYTLEELTQLLCNDIVNSYVILDGDKIVDFFSYVNINYQTVNSGQLFLYTLCTTYGETMLKQLLNIMTANNVDVFMTTDNMATSEMLLAEKYETNCDSDTGTHVKLYENRCMRKDKYYVNLYNWRTPYVSSDRIALFTIV